MRIAVLADTHNRYPSDLPERLSRADEIWHLGDVCSPETLADFAQIGPPLRVILGNNDSCEQWPITMELDRAGWRLHLVHIPPPRPPAKCDVVLHGHTHMPRDEIRGGIRWLNPGCITRPSHGAPRSFAWLTLLEGKPLGWELVRL